MKWTPDLGPLVKVWSVLLCRNRWSDQPTKSRKKFDAGFKAKIALEALREDDSGWRISGQAAWVHPSQIYAWKKQVLDNVASLFERGAKWIGRRR